MLSLGSSMESMSAERETALVGVRFSRGSVCKAVSVYRRARACPSPCLGRGNGVGLRAFFAQVERSRRTGPRATGQEGSPHHAPFGIRRSRNYILLKVRRTLMSIEDSPPSPQGPLGP